MSNSGSNFRIMLQAMLDKVKSIANIKSDIKAIEPKLPKVKVQGKLDKTATQKELNSKIKTIKPKVKVDADTTQAEKKIKKIGKQKNKTTITPTVDNTQVVSGLKQAQKETKTLWERFTSGIIGANLVRMAVQRVTQAIREAIETVKELDTIKTNIQMVSGTSDSDVNAMMSSYNAMAKDLSSTTKDVAEAANEFLRMGESIQNTNELIRSSQILSKVGMIESSDAASYLISSLKGYKVAAEDSLDIVSKLTSVDLEAAVSAGGLSEALSKCANIASNSGVTMDRLIGYTATVGETTQKSMSEVGNSFQALLSRMNNIKIGRFIDDETGESLSDTEAVLNKLGIQLRDTENTYRSFDDVLDDVGSRWESFTKVEQNALSVAIAGTRQRENFEALMNNWGNALKYSETAANSAGSALERYGVYQDSIEAKTNELTAALESLSTNTISEGLYSGIIEATTGIVEFLDKTNLLKGALSGLVAMGVSKAIASIGAGFITAAKSTAQLSAAMALFDKGRSEQNLLDIGAACKGLSDQQLKLVLSTKGLEFEDRKLILKGMGVTEAEREQTLTTLGLAKAENVATASTFSLKGAWTALKTAFLSSPVGWVTAAVAAVGLLTKGYLTLAESAERCKERADEIMSSFRSALDTANSNAKTVEGLAEKYAALSKGVNNLGENVLLTADEYSEYNEIVNQIADMFPTLVKGYTDEGNAILSLKGNVEGLRDAYKEAQMEAFNLLIASGKDSDGNDILKDANNVINNAKMGGLFGKGTTPGGNRQTIEYIDEISEIFSQDNYKDILLAKTGLGTSFDPSDDDEVFRKWFTYLTGIPADGRRYISDITDEQVAEILKQLKISKQTLNAEINSAVDNVETIANAYLMINENYAKLDEQSRNAASMIVNSLNADIVSSFGENKENVGKYVDNIVQIISANPEVQDALIGLFSLDTINMPVNEAKSLINTYIRYIAAVIEEDPLELKVRLGFDDTVDIANRLRDSIRQITDDHGMSDREGSAALSEYTRDFTQAQAEMWLEVTLGAQDATEAIRMYEDALADAADAPVPTISIPDTITQLNTQLKPTFDSLKSAYNDIFTDDGEFALNSIDILSTCDSIKSKLDELNEMEGITVDYSTYENLVSVLSDTESTEQDVEIAFDSLATSITQAALTGKEDFSTMKAALEDLGVVNNEIVAFDALLSNTEALKEAFAQANVSMDDFIVSTEDGSVEATKAGQAFIEEMVGAENAAQAIAMLSYQKALCNEQGMNTAGEVANLKTLAENAGYTGEVIQYLTELEQIYQEVASGTIDPGVIGAKIIRAAQLQTLIQGAAAKIDYKPIERSAAKAGKAAGKSYADALKDELSNLNSVISYIGDVIGDQIDLFEEQKDAAVEALKKEKKSIEDALNAEKSLIQEKINNKQKEIDAIKEASESRRRETELMLAQYNLEKLMNQRTILQYSENKGMHYVTDTKDIREAKEAVTEAKENIQIAGMEKEISGLNDTIDGLDKKIEESNKYYDELIEQTEKYWDSLIKGLEEYKSRWQELADIENQAKMEAMLRELGITTEDVLNMSESAFESFKGTYLGLLNEMYSGNDEMRGILQEFGGITGDTLRPLSGTIDTVAESLDDYAGAASTAGTNTAKVSENVGTLSTNTEGLNDNLSGVSDTLNDILEDNKLESVAEQLGDVAESVQSVSDALNDMPDKLDMGGVTEQFDALGNSVDKVSASISGGNASKADTSGGDPGKNTPNAQGNPGGSPNSLVSAIKEVKSETDKSIGTGEGSGAIGQFGQLGESVEDVTAAVGGGSGNRNTNSSETSGDLISSIETLGETTTETLGEPDGEGVIGKFGEMGDTIAEAENHVQGIIDKMDELDGMTAECSIVVNVQTVGGVPAYAEGTAINTDFESGEFTAEYGKAFAEGTGKYQGLPKAEKNALVSEYGQTEMTVLPNGDTIITDEPTLMDLPKDTVIFNEDQTRKIMDNKVDASGKAHAGGTDDSIWTTLADGSRVRDLQPGDKMYDLMQKYDAYLEKINYNLDMLTPNSVYEHQRQMEQMAKQITNNSVINNIAHNRNVQPSVTFGDIYVTCPGVTEQQVAEKLPYLLDKELDRKFTGFSNYADQYSRRR